MNEKTPIACSLSGDDYQQRLAAVQAIGRRAWLDTEVRSDGVTLTFRNDGDVRDELMALAAAESDCCPFLAISLDADGSRLRVSISGPVEAIPIVRDVARSFQGEVLT